MASLKKLSQTTNTSGQRTKAKTSVLNASTRRRGHLDGLCDAFWKGVDVDARVSEDGFMHTHSGETKAVMARGQSKNLVRDIDSVPCGKSLRGRTEAIRK